MSDVFISYSRTDEAFVRRLDERLQRSGKDTWVDWRDIPASADWMEEIYRAIEDAHLFVYVLSPASVSSEVCARELAHAAAHNKRIVPLECRKVDARAVPGAAARSQWISFDGDGFERSFGTLAQALETDPAQLAAHTHWLRRASDWQREGRDKSLLLRGRDLRSAEDWLAGEVPGTSPEPTALQREYIHSSGRASARRQRAVTVGVAAALVVSIGLAVFALIQRDTAIEQKEVAQSQALTVSARAAADSNPLLAVQLAREAVDVVHTPAGEAVLRTTLSRLDHRVLLRGHDDQVVSAAFSPDGERVVTASPDRTARMWDAASGDQIMMLRGHRDEVEERGIQP